MTGSRWRVGLAAIAVILIGAAVLYWAWPAAQNQRAGGGRFRAGGEGPVPVLVAAAHRADVPVYFDGVGTTKALNTVTVRPQVDGKLISIAFKEGQDVEKGYVLARIDPTTYQAQYDQAVAKKAQDEAQLANARRDLERYQRLAETNAGSKQQADTQAATVAQLQAQVNSDQAAIDNAKAILDYTNITAPIAGRTGIRQVDEGNIVRASDANGLVVITQLKPLSVLFSVPQQQLDPINKAFTQAPLPVEAMGADGKSVIDRGMLQVIDNQIDPTTGTVRLKADFPNASLQLWPGQFINVRLLVDTLKQAIVIPTASVQRGPAGPFVYVVAASNDTVSVRPVTVAQQDDAQAVITNGLQADERVVTSGFARLASGARIAISSGDAMTAPASSTSPANDRPRRRGEGAAQSDQPRQGGQPRGQNAGGNQSANP